MEGGLFLMDESDLVNKILLELMSSFNEQQRTLGETQAMVKEIVESDKQQDDKIEETLARVREIDDDIKEIRSKREKDKSNIAAVNSTVTTIKGLTYILAFTVAMTAYDTITKTFPKLLPAIGDFLAALLGIR